MFATPTKKHIKWLVSAATKRIYKATILPRRCTTLLLLLAIASYSIAPVESSRSQADALDKTDCNGVVLDDSPFTEAIMRDHRDKSYGALSNSAVRPLGGGEGYGNIVMCPPEVVHPGRWIVQRQAVVVRTADELRARLRATARLPQVIYVDDAAEIDLSYCAKKPTPRV